MVQRYREARVSERNHPLIQLLESSTSRIELRNPLGQADFGRNCRTCGSARGCPSGIVQLLQTDISRDNEFSSTWFLEDSRRFDTVPPEFAVLGSNVIIRPESNQFLRVTMNRPRHPDVLTRDS